MLWSPDVLPHEAGRWTLHDAVLSNGAFTIQPSGYAYCTLTPDDLELLPEILQVAAITNRAIRWQNADVIAAVEATYTSGYDKAVVALDTTDNNVSITPGEYTSLQVRFINKSTQAVVISEWHLYQAYTNLTVQQIAVIEAKGVADAALGEATTAVYEALARSRTFNQAAGPTPPYALKDLWLDGTGAIHVCTTARSTGAYNAADWSAWAIKADYVVANVAIDAPVITGGVISGATLQTSPLTTVPRVKIYQGTYGGVIEFWSAGGASPESVIEQVNMGAYDRLVISGGTGLAITADALELQAGEGYIAFDAGDIITGGAVDCGSMTAAQLYAMFTDGVGRMLQFNKVGNEVNINVDVNGTWRRLATGTW